MNTSAILMMAITMLLVTGFAVYFFVKVLRSPTKDDPA